MDSSDLQPRRKAPTGSTRGVLLLFGGLFALVFIVQFLTIAWDIFAPRDQQPVLNKAEAEWVDPRLLAADPSAYRDRNIVLYGKALTVEGRFDHTRVQLMAQPRGDNTTESIAVELRGNTRDVLGDGCYKIYGVGAGTQRVTPTTTGAQNELPLVRGYAWERSPRGERRVGCVTP